MADTQHIGEFLTAIDELGPGFDVLDSAPIGVRVSDVRRRRGRLSDDAEAGYRDISLVERDGVFLWLDPDDLGAVEDGGRRRPRRGRRGWRRGPQGANLIKEVTVPVLEPNEYLGALRDTDMKLNGECDSGLRVVKAVTRNGTVSFEATKEGLKQNYSGKTLVLVHGTFSSSANTLSEYASTEHGVKFILDALKSYKGQVLVFDHPTLSVSPFLNGLDLARALSGTTGEVDVIAHSRGGLVVRWWLEVLGASLQAKRVRAVLVGSPLNGTSLAAPNRIQPLLGVLTNVGSYVSRTLGIAATANPFTLASFALLKFVVRREKNRWGIPPVADIGSRPGTDAAVAVIPGLQGQSAVSNNFELGRLRLGPARTDLDYFAITADFEPEKVGWKLWKVFTEFKDRGVDFIADKVFPAENDLVVDTSHMTSLATDRRIDLKQTFAFGQQDAVHHLNYFRSQKTIAQLRRWLS